MNGSWTVLERKVHNFFNIIVIKFWKIIYDIAQFFKIKITKKFINLSAPSYICYICWICLLYTLSFDNWAKFWILELIHFLKICLATIKTFLSESSMVVSYTFHVIDSISNQYVVWGTYLSRYQKNHNHQRYNMPYIKCNICLKIPYILMYQIHLLNMIIYTKSFQFHLSFE